MIYHDELGITKFGALLIYVILWFGLLILGVHVILAPIASFLITIGLIEIL